MCRTRTALAASALFALFLFAAFLFAAAGSPTASAGFLGPNSGVTGNDTGGIIQWAPGVDYRAIAVAHCAQWNRFAGISSYPQGYGDYAGFRCVVDRRFDPRKGRGPY